MRRQQKQRGQMLHWWHLVAQDLHHHRRVLQTGGVDAAVTGTRPGSECAATAQACHLST